MNPIIPRLFEEGDFFLKEAKSMFYLKKEEECDATCKSCKAIKKYLDAYEQFLFKNLKLTENYHVLLHIIMQKDPDFIAFNEKIFEVKCFAEESRSNKEEFFLYADEVDSVLKIVLEVRNYVASKIKFNKEFLAEFNETSFMTT